MPHIAYGVHVDVFSSSSNIDILKLGTPLVPFSLGDGRTYIEVDTKCYFAFWVSSPTVGDPDRFAVNISLDGIEAANVSAHDGIITTWGNAKWAGAVPFTVGIADVAAAGAGAGAAAQSGESSVGTITMTVTEVRKYDNPISGMSTVTTYVAAKSATALAGKAAAKLGIAAAVPTQLTVSRATMYSRYLDLTTRVSRTLHYRDGLGIDLIRSRLGLAVRGQGAGAGHAVSSSSYCGVASAASHSSLGKRKAQEATRDSDNLKASGAVHVLDSEPAPLTLFDLTQDQDASGASGPRRGKKSKPVSYVQIPVVQVRVCYNDGKFATKVARVPDDDVIEVIGGADSFVLALLADSTSALQLSSPAVVAWTMDGVRILNRRGVLATSASSASGTTSPLVVVGTSTRQAFVKQAEVK